MTKYEENEKQHMENISIFHSNFQTTASAIDTHWANKERNVRMEVINGKNQQTILMDIDINVTNPPQILLDVWKLSQNSHSAFAVQISLSLRTSEIAKIWGRCN